MPFDNAPAPGSRWTRESLGGGVVHVYQNGVLLVSDDGVEHRIPGWAWPDGWMLVPGDETGTTQLQPILALQVGGESGKHFVADKKLATRIGIDIIEHIPGTTRQVIRLLPQRVDLIILLTSHVGHPAMWSVKALAERQGIPVVTTTSENYLARLQEAVARIQPKILERRRSRETYGAGVDVLSPTWWEWNDEDLVWVLHGIDEVDDVAPPPGIPSGGGSVDTVLAGLLGLASVAALTR